MKSQVYCFINLPLTEPLAGEDELLGDSDAIFALRAVEACITPDTFAVAELGVVTHRSH